MLVGSYELLMVIVRSVQVPAAAVAEEVPSVRTIRARLHAGQPRAQRLRAYLTALSSP